MDHTNVFLYLQAENPSATAAFQLAHNARFLYQKDIEYGTQRVTKATSRTGTPDVEAHEPMTLALSIAPGHEPYHPGRFLFGSDSNDEEVDILLAPKAAVHGVSRRHFTISLVRQGMFITNHSRFDLRVVTYSSSDLRISCGQHRELRQGWSIMLGFVSLRIRLPIRSVIEAACYSDNLATLEQELGFCLPRLPAPSTVPQTVTEPKTLRLGYSLGSSNLAKVYQAQSGDGKAYAVKVYNSRCFKPHWLAREERISRRLNHPNLIAMYWDFPAPLMPAGKPCLNPYIVMDYAPCGTLMEVKLETHLQAQTATCQLAGAIAYLYANTLTHRDVKPDNVLVTRLSPIHVVLADFYTLTDQPLATDIGSPIFQAPEVRTGTYTKNVDLWSFGMVSLLVSAPDMWDALSMAIEIFDAPDMDAMYASVCKISRIPYPPERANLRATAFKCLVKQDERPSATTVAHSLEEHIKEITAGQEYTG